MDTVIRAYKKRIKAQQRRIQREHDQNKRLLILLKYAKDNVNPDSVVYEMIQHELKMNGYKYK